MWYGSFHFDSVFPSYRYDAASQDVSAACIVCMLPCLNFSFFPIGTMNWNNDNTKYNMKMFINYYREKNTYIVDNWLRTSSYLIGDREKYSYEMDKNKWYLNRRFDIWVVGTIRYGDVIWNTDRYVDPP